VAFVAHLEALRPHVSEEGSAGGGGGLIERHGRRTNAAAVADAHGSRLRVFGPPHRAAPVLAAGSAIPKRWASALGEAATHWEADQTVGTMAGVMKSVGGGGLDALNCVVVMSAILLRTGG
jgi:hypothetical protein